jgi:broad specificity phosphatase PhoE
MRNNESLKLLLVRHAESEANAGYKTSNPATIGITEKGRTEAFELANTISAPPDLIIVTPYIRTYQTARPLIDKFPHTPIETWPLHEFTFLSPLACQNTTSLDRLPLVKEYWNKCDPFFVHGPGAESFAQFSQRVTEALQKLKSYESRNVVIFTHGQVMRFAKQYFENLSQPSEMAMEYFRDRMLVFPVPNTWVLNFNL